jgi:hypothetical protein
MEDSALSKIPPRIELHLKRRKLIADGKEAIDAIRRPLQMLLYSMVVCLVIYALSLLGVVSYVRTLL